MKKTDFSEWNYAYMITHFLNIVYASSIPKDSSSQPALISVIYFQAIIFTLLLFSKGTPTALLSILVPSAAFIPWSMFTGINDPVHVFFMPAMLCLVIIVVGIPRSRLLQRTSAASHRDEDIKNPGMDATSTDNPKTRRMLVAFDAGTTCGITLLMVAIAMVFMQSTLAVSWALSFLVIVPALLVVLDLVFNVAQLKRRMIYHPLLTHHFIEESNHTIQITFGKLDVFVCTRCAGMLTGLFLSMYGFVAFKIALPPLVALVVDCFLPVPVFVDWGTQRLGIRQSTTRSRVVTGMVVGLGFALVPQCAPDYALASAVLLMIYFAIFILLFVAGVRRVSSVDDDELAFTPEPEPPSE